MIAKGMPRLVLVCLLIAGCNRGEPPGGPSRPGEPGAPPAPKYRMNTGVKLWPPDGDRDLLCLSADGKTVLTQADHRIKVFDLAASKELLTVGPLSRSTMPVALSPDGRWIAYVERPEKGKDDETVFLKEVRNGAERRIDLPRNNLALKLAFAPTGDLLACLSPTHCGVWNLTGRAPIMKWEIKRERELGSGLVDCVFFDRGKKLAVGAEDGTVWLTENATGDSSQIIRGIKPLKSLNITPDGKRLACLALFGSEVWDVEKEKTLLPILAVPPSREYHRRLLGDGTAISVGSDHTILARDRDGGNKRILGSAGGRVQYLTLNVDGTLVAAATEDGMVSVWDVR